MAASSKPSGAQFAVAFFVMTTLICALMWWITGSKVATLTASQTASADAAATANTDLNKAREEISALKRSLGIELDAIGGADDVSPDTVLGAMNGLLRTIGRDEVQPNPPAATISASLQTLRSALDGAKTQVQQMQAGAIQTQAELEQERKAHQERADQLASSQQSSEDQLQQTVAKQNDLLASKDQDIEKWRQQYRTEQVAKEQFKDELDKVRVAKDNEIATLENLNDFLRQRMNAIEDMSFDRPDGKIVQVDNTTRTVWINLGNQDNLREQVTFSVYTRDHRGVGRGKADIKAKIEVTKIRDSHLAEARILQEDISRPIQAGDPIYSPAWAHGAKEHFSFVGVVDMDNDGKSDRELLHSMLENAGAGVEVEIDDEGNRIPADGVMTVKTKFLVVGEIEDPAKFPGFDTAKQAAIRKVSSEYQELNKEALRKGIKVVNFRDFLNYMGYEPQQRLYNTGERRPFNLRGGAREAAIDNVLGSQRFQPTDRTKRFGSEAPKSQNAP